MPRTFTAAEKAAVALEAIKEMKTYAEISSLHEVHSSQIKRWKKILVDGVVNLFSDREKKDGQEKNTLIGELYKIIGEREAELSWLKKKMRGLGP